jgi:HD-GYP domain-containing protein (c-di-GMP phosphodiesterase class II)
MSRLFTVPSRYLTVGEPIAYDLRSPNDVLLLSKGQVISGGEQINAILKIGPCVNAEDAFKLGLITIEELQGPQESPSLPVKPSKPTVHRPFDLVAEWYAKTDVLYSQHLELAKRVESIAQSIYDAVSICPQPLCAGIFLVPFKKYTSAHAVHCAIVITMTALALKIPENDTVSILKAALLMNIGNAKLQDSLFEHNKVLNPSCKAIIKQHPLVSHNIAKTHGVLDELTLRIILEHHEQPDGTGYPQQLVENKIHYYSKILHIVDILLAKMTHRSYRKAMAIRKAMGTLLNAYADQDSIQIIQSVIKAVGLYPPGTALKLPSGEVAIVTYRHDNMLETWAVLKDSGERLAIPLKRKIDLHSISDLSITYSTPLIKFINPHQLFGFK